MPERTQNAGEYESIITVRFHPQVGVAAINNISGSLNLTELRRTKSNFIDYQLADGADLMAIANSLRSLPQVEAVQLNTFGEFLGMPNDPLANDSQWHIERLNLDEVWDYETGSEKVIIAVIDTGLDFNHPDIGFGDDGYSNLYFNKVEDDWSDPNDPSSGNGIDDDDNGKIDDWRGWNSVENNNDVLDTGSHGTRMAGFIAAKTNNNEGVAGVAGGFGTPGV
ncbi:MAG: S8 family serine peptidase, partial [Bacteroidota bacterium]